MTQREFSRLMNGWHAFFGKYDRLKEYTPIHLIRLIAPTLKWCNSDPSPFIPIDLQTALINLLNAVLADPEDFQIGGMIKNLQKIIESVMSFEVGTQS